ncbi:MAG: cell division protein FtsZ [Prolixibacteraceae bacterium]|nr:cell division protein FtsZ [Prolixibacteraceae bacterium]MBN2648893.1 cell division protein FtsZ [Prolixibacteraceae bacterium]
MSEKLLNFSSKPGVAAQIKVIGVGGGGGNAVNYMFRKGITDVGFMLCNTDAQALENSPVELCVPLGGKITEGRGAGNMPELGRRAAEESIDQIRDLLENTTDMVFITACMGGGTGTGAAPVVAEVCKELGILTIAVVTVPAKAEGRKRYDQAIEGVNQIKQHVDSLLVINNDKIREIYGNLPASQAFSKADEILATAVKGIAEIITLHGSINIDFADVSTVLSGSRVFIMGTGYAEGEGRAMKAVEYALESPLLDSNDIYGTDEILLNITSGTDEITIGEIGNIIEYLQEKAGDDANIIWGNGFDDSLGTRISVTIVATGFKTNPSAILQEQEKEPEQKVALEISDEQVFINEDVDEDSDLFETESKIQVSQDSLKEPLPKKTRKKENKKDGWLKRQLDLFFEEKSVDMDN